MERSTERDEEKEYIGGGGGNDSEKVEKRELNVHTFKIL